jgi:hypothetical protein
MKELSIIVALILTSCLSLAIISGNNNPGFSVVAQTNKTKTQTFAANNISTTTNTTKTSSSIVDTFSESGTMNSLIYLSSDNNNSILGAAKKFIIFGDWNLVIKQGVVKDFQAKFINVLPDGTRWHSHELVNFRTDNNNNTKIHLNGDNSVPISGTVDIKLDDSDAWKGVKTNIIISKGNIISIFIDGLTTGEHFRGQPIYGTVQSIRDGNGNEIKKMVEKQLTP